MVAAFLDSWLTGDPEEDRGIMEVCRARLGGGRRRGRPGRPAVPGRRGHTAPVFAWGQAVRRAVLAVLLVHAVLGLRAGAPGLEPPSGRWLPAPPASLAVIAPALARCMAWRASLDRDFRGAGPRALPHGPGPRGTGHRPRPGRLAASPAHRHHAGAVRVVELLGPVRSCPVLAMTAFHRDAPPARRLALAAGPAAGYLLVYVPVLALQATGNSAWLPDFSRAVLPPGRLACLAHAPGPGPAGPPARACGCWPWRCSPPSPGYTERRYRLRHRPAPDHRKPDRTGHPGGRRRADHTDAARAQTATPAPPPYPGTIAA